MSTEGPSARERMWRAQLRLDYVTPCQQEPDTWNAPDGTGRRETVSKADKVYQRLVRAMKGCATCKVRSECGDTLKEEDHPLGVWAGIVFYNPEYVDLNRAVQKYFDV